ncbi:hypothetical protein DdX_06685 [Ditylenchus destructor]|uniref:Uncharacterized protein n=1 Tax=Ditylenchus destructor TaxID=166010 RepID=A0AAD4R969_9BILA|nr:hypothetical protein DdX_06685 [Ditylenchus destructor]
MPAHLTSVMLGWLNLFPSGIKPCLYLGVDYLRQHRLSSTRPDFTPVSAIRPDFAPVSPTRPDFAPVSAIRPDFAPVSPPQLNSPGFHSGPRQHLALNSPGFHSGIASPSDFILILD